MNDLNDGQYTAFIGIDWADTGNSQGTCRLGE